VDLSLADQESDMGAPSNLSSNWASNNWKELWSWEGFKTRHVRRATQWFIA